MGLNPGAVYWMDMTFFTLVCCENFYCLFEKTKNKQKGAGLSQFVQRKTKQKQDRYQPTGLQQ